MRFLLLAALALTALQVSAAVDLSQAIQLNVEKYQLPNGLTVLLQEDHSVPLVSYHQWFRVGSKDEEVGRTGLAHFFEHMMFKGTPKYSKDYFSQELTSRGAQYNAFTNADYTGYYITVPKEHLKIAINIESDRMRNLTLDPKDVQSEREVVKEERRLRYDNQPEGIIRETLSDMMFKSLPYRWMVIGSMADLNQASMADFRAFYKRYYSPNNAVVVVAGDFDSQMVKNWIKSAYGSIPAEKIDRHEYPAEPEQKKALEKTVTKNVQSPIVAISYVTPPASNPDTFSTDLITVLLAQGDSSRLHKKLVYQQQIATGVGAACHDQILASYCQVYVYLKPGVQPKKVAAIVAKEIEDLIKKKVSDKELTKAKNNYMMEYVNQLRKVGGRAEAIAYNEILFGDYRKLFNDIPNVQAVTAEQIQQAAKKYFQPERKNTVIVLPAKKES